MINLFLSLVVLFLAGCLDSTSPILKGITISPEKRCTPYVRSRYSYTAAKEEGRIMKEMQGIYDPYVAKWLNSPFQSDVEHVVAAAEAHDSGLCASSKEEKARFAQDPENLVLAGSYLNRYIKVAKDAGEWLPEKNKCWYVHTIIKIKKKYSLTMDQAEYNAIQKVLERCVTYKMKVVKK